MKNKIFKIISFLTAALIISSCLKDDIGEDWTASLKGKMYAEIWNGGFVAFPLEPVATPDTFKFLVNIATDELPKTDIVVTVAVNEDVIAKYNTLKGTDYALFPYIEIINPTVTIKAGTRNKYVYVKVWNADQLNPCDNFMAPVSITSVTGGVIIADEMNQGSRLMGLPINNAYAGHYVQDGYRDHPDLGLIDAHYDDIVLSTIDCKTVIKPSTGDYIGYHAQIEITETKFDVGGHECKRVIVTIPETTDMGMYDDAELGIPVNYWDTVDKKFELYYWYQASAKRKIRETLTKK